ncbi:MAG: glycosyltransferase [Lachnospiraceae bacterium]|nr:glycosyltransferase [Lachnospiraceae bacterium]
MNEPVRVLHVFGRTGRGGAESRMMDLYRAIDRERIQFDFLVHASASGTGRTAPSSDELMAVRPADDFDAEIRALGGHIYALPRMSFSPGKTGIIAYQNACEKFFREHEGIWRVVQGHMTSTAALYLASAKRSGVPVTIAHARSAGRDPGIKGVLTGILRRPLGDESRIVRLSGGGRAPLVDHRFACSREAGEAVFGKAGARVIPNAIPVEAFRFRADMRERMRSELHLENCRVIGHVGSFRYAKNHGFLLRSFQKLQERTGDKSLRLLLVGNGELYEQTQADACALGIREQVVFTGSRGNVNDLYQAMDLFAFPSRYEGVPGSVIEAQAAALPCIVSDRITPDVDVTELVHREAIGDTVTGITQAQQRWADRMEELLASNGDAGERTRLSDRVGSSLAEAGYDAVALARRMERFYLTGELS